MEKVANIYHEAIENKVNKIAEEMKKYEETEEEELVGLQEAGIRSGIEEFEFKQTTLEEVEEILMNLPRKTSAGEDQVSYIELRDGAYYVAPLLTKIINLIIETSFWPKQWSNSLIKPLLKVRVMLTTPCHIVQLRLLMR